VREHVASAIAGLASRHPQVHSVLIAALGDPFAGVRRAAADALLQLAWPADAIVPTLQELLKELRSGIRHALAMRGVQRPRSRPVKIPRLGKTIEEAISALTKVLGMKGESLYFGPLKTLAIRALGAVGPRARAAVPALNAILQGGSWDEREAAKEALV